MKKIQKTVLALLATTTLLSAGLEEILKVTSLRDVKLWMVPPLTTSVSTLVPTQYTRDSLTPYVYDSKKPQPSKSLQFIIDNRETLEVEVAKGEGETLDTLATLYHKVKEEDQGTWKLKLQENYEQIFHPNGRVAADKYVDSMIRSFDVPAE